MIASDSGNISHVRLQLISRDHLDYERACKVISEVYRKRLGMAYAGFPATLIVAYNRQDEILGSIGLTRGDQVEHLGIQNHLGDLGYPPREVAEVNRLNITDRRLHRLAPLLVAAAFFYALNTGVKWVFATTHAAAHQLLLKMQIPIRFVSTVNIDAYGAVGGAVYRKRAPKAFIIGAAEAAEAAKQFINNSCETLDATLDTALNIQS